MPAPLPIDAVLPDLARVLAAGANAVLQAPPGAGKTTRVPLALLEQPWAAEGRILMLEPRRVAARAAAERMAESLGEAVGETVGYRIRSEAKVSRRTRIEVVTEGILTRRLQGDPELTGVAMVIFDEFHERSLNAELGLALCLEAQAALRGDLRLLVMSATLDGEAVARLMGSAPVVTSAGRSFPVETRWLDAPWSSPGRRGPRFEEAVARLITRAVAEEAGDVLAFLPGVGEINRTAARLGDLQGPFDVIPLHGAVPFAKQRRALEPAATGRRKIVLATAIAETSLTIDGVRIVVDGGRARRARFDPRSGMTRLITERVSRAGADQRRGRAGRTEPGVCYRLWTKGEEGGFAPYAAPEILEADLAPLALELAAWGASDPSDLPWLDPPPAAAYTQARALLADLGALDAAGRITAYGRALSEAPTHPRLAHMLTQAGEDADAAAALAALLEDRDPLRRAEVDAALRLELLRDPRRFAEERPHAFDRAVVQRLREAARDLSRRMGRRFSPEAIRPAAAGPLLALAYPDRIGARRKGDAPRYLLSGGKGAALDEADPLAKAPLLVAAELDGDAREARIRIAAPLARSELEAAYALAWVEVCEWSRRDGMVLARKRLQIGAAILEDRIWRDVPPEALAAGMAEALRDLGLQALPWTPAARRFQARAEWARAAGLELPAMDDDALLADLDAWLVPHLAGMRKKDDLAGLDLAALLRGRLDWPQSQALDAAAPAHFVAPTGSKAPIDYGGDTPSFAIRLQELFGLAEHPRIGPQRLAPLIELLSPAGRPVQITADLPGFWASSYADVRKDLRGCYPRHPWPENPLEAEPTRRAKPRKQP